MRSCDVVTRKVESYKLNGFARWRVLPRSLLRRDHPLQRGIVNRRRRELCKLRIPRWRGFAQRRQEVRKVFPPLAWFRAKAPGSSQSVSPAGVVSRKGARKFAKYFPRWRGFAQRRQEVRKVFPPLAWFRAKAPGSSQSVSPAGMVSRKGARKFAKCFPRWRPSTLKLRQLKIFARRSLGEGEGWREAPGVDCRLPLADRAPSAHFIPQQRQAHTVKPAASPRKFCRRH
jgi:hypothetical protein